MVGSLHLLIFVNFLPVDLFFFLFIGFLFIVYLYYVASSELYSFMCFQILPGKVFISPLFLKDSFTGHNIFLGISFFLEFLLFFLGFIFF